MMLAPSGKVVENRRYYEMRAFARPGGSDEQTMTLQLGVAQQLACQLVIRKATYAALFIREGFQCSSQLCVSDDVLGASEPQTYS